MDEYRLYTVVPELLKFLDNLTNIYVRFNRKGLKGRTGEDDCHTALSILYNVLLTFCKVMSPFTPLFTETMYQNLRKACEGSEESIHYCTFPKEKETRDKRIENSVESMMKIIDVARNVGNRHELPLRTPLKEMIVVHPDAEFLDDITGKLKQYVLEELNVRSLVPCNDTLNVLGKRLGKSMGLVAAEVKKMSQQDILRFEETEEVTIAKHSLTLSDIKIVRIFKRPDGLKDTEIDAAGDGDVLVIFDLQEDESLKNEGVACEIVNRIQKLRTNSCLEPTDIVEVYIKPLDMDESVVQQVLHSQEQYIREKIGSPLLLSTLMPPDVVIISELEDSKLSFKIYLAKQIVKFNEEAVLALCSGSVRFATRLKTIIVIEGSFEFKIRV